jgi:spore germination cell wall hydrolase CwlJ-like protein
MNRDKFEKIVIVLAVLCSISIMATATVARNSEGTYTRPVSIDIPLRTSPYSKWPFEISEEDVEYLALNIYFEARNDSIKSQYAVADVVMFRTMHHNFPNTITDVIKDGDYPSWDDSMPIKYRCAFTWMCDRRSDVPTDEHAYTLARLIADDVLFNPDYKPAISYALYYHAYYVTPRWSKVKKYVGTVGFHHYYANP